MYKFSLFVGFLISSTSIIAFAQNNSNQLPKKIPNCTNDCNYYFYLNKWVMYNAIPLSWEKTLQKNVSDLVGAKNIEYGYEKQLSQIMTKQILENTGLSEKSTLYIQLVTPEVQNFTFSFEQIVENGLKMNILDDSKRPRMDEITFRLPKYLKTKITDELIYGVVFFGNNNTEFKNFEIINFNKTNEIPFALESRDDDQRILETYVFKKDDVSIYKVSSFLRNKYYKKYDPSFGTEKDTQLDEKYFIKTAAGFYKIESFFDSFSTDMFSEETIKLVKEKDKRIGSDLFDMLSGKRAKLFFGQINSKKIIGFQNGSTYEGSQMFIIDENGQVERIIMELAEVCQVLPRTNPILDFYL